MAHPPEYKFCFAGKNEKFQSIALIYELWVSPNKDKVELVIDSESKYVQLDKNKSQRLFKILTGEKLSGLNYTQPLRRTETGLWIFRDLYQTPGFGDTTDFHAIKVHYHLSNHIASEDQKSKNILPRVLTTVRSLFQT